MTVDKAVLRNNYGKGVLIKVEDQIPSTESNQILQHLTLFIVLIDRINKAK